MNNNTTLENFIKTFVLKDKRERSEFELKNEKKRSKFTARLNHEWDSVLDMRLVTRIPSGVDDYEFAKKQMNITDDELCYIISNYDSLDGAIDPFHRAFEKVYGKGFGSLVIPVSGGKFYLETELVHGKQNRFVGRER